MPGGAGTSSPWAPPPLWAVPWGHPAAPSPTPQWVQPLISLSFLQGGYTAYRYAQPAAAAAAYSDR